MIRKRYWLGVSILLTCAIAGFGAAATANPYVGLGAFIVGVFSSLYVMALSCPKCGVPLLLKEEMVLGHKAKMWWPNLPARCGNCGEPVA
jgi:hypothetical protein